ncbi:IclR family transcriptional regulator [Ramlibacter rhizophilus]|uniref:IclR family transcriptional regulator n=2 Tax=Ramlibacter rhizophilus TaxID=1781167 RepID=A0A4Z0BYB9_9BURK|nr:IclR family transcriptional regulator [Ramlibacter rhizophilus]TFZ03514.1 IclR family transcriptional regulator [Ramlibacter rhizophilus]
MGSIALPGLVHPHDLADDRQFSMNLARGLEVLRAFTATAPLLGNREIADRTGLPKPTVSRLTYTLTLLGYLTRDAALQKYRLGSGVLSLSHPLLASLNVRQAARPLMEQLARKTGCTVNLGMRDRADIVYVDTVRADAANLHLPDIGSTRPLLATSMGRALILGMPAAERTAILNYLKVHDRALYDQHRPAWEADLKLFAAHGFCHSRGDWQKDVHAVAVPVRLPQREQPVAMNCTLAAYRMRRDQLTREVAPLLMETVRQLEAAHGLRSTN